MGRQRRRGNLFLVCFSALRHPEVDRLQKLNRGLECDKAEQAIAAQLAAEKLRAFNQELDFHKGERDAAMALVERMRVSNHKLELDRAERDAALASREQSLAELRRLFDKPENWLFAEQNLANKNRPPLAEQP